MDEVVAELLFQLVAWFGAPLFDFLWRLFWWFVVGGLRTLWALLVHGFRNGFCFYRDLWLRLRWTRRSLFGRSRIR